MIFLINHINFLQVLPSRRALFLYTQIYLHSLNCNPLVWYFRKSKTSQFNYATR